MAGYIPAEKIEEIRQAADIVEIVSAYVTLKRRGKNYFGLCPFHTEKTPSFSVNPEKQIFHCFGCQIGGNVITFIMKIENLSFPEAVEFLADKLGIELPRQPADEEKSRERLRLFQVNQFAADFYFRTLFSEEGARARQYLKRRGFNRQIVEAFRIGYAPNRWDGLIKAAQARNIPLEDLERVGLILPSQKAREGPGRVGYYDRFRDRIMFPIHNLSGMVVGFGGRIVSSSGRTGPSRTSPSRTGETDAPKYMNTPETPLFQKGKILYGLDKARDFIRQQDQLILVEGYIDLLSLVQFGIQNVAATSGTALTADQARLIARYTRRVVILYDGDLAGAMAALRGVDVLISEGLHVRVALLPSEHDPDSFIRSEGPEELRRLIDGAREFLDFKIFCFQQTQPMDSPQKKAELIQSLAETISKMPDEITRNLYIHEVSERLGVAEASIARAVARRLSLGRPRTGQEPAQPGVKQGLPGQALPAAQRAERDLITAVIRYPELAPFVFEYLELAEVQKPEHREILQAMYDQLLDQGQVDPTRLMNDLDDPEMLSLLASTLLAGEAARAKSGKAGEGTREVPPEIKRFVEDCLVVIRRERVRREIEEVRREIKQARAEGKDEAALVERYLQLKKKQEWIQAKKFLEPG